MYTQFVIADTYFIFWDVSSSVADDDGRVAVVKMSSVKLKELHKEDSEVGLFRAGLLASRVKLKKADNHQD